MKSLAVLRPVWNKIPFCLLLGPLLVSCGSESQELGENCTADGDCSSGYCLTDPAFPEGCCSKDCRSDGLCPEGFTCHDIYGGSYCLRSCTADSECREGYVCDYKVCRPACKEDSFCQGQDKCMAGHCKARCTADSDCPQGKRCQDGKCLPPCKSDTECLPGYRCDTSSGKCVAKPGKPMGQSCTQSSECATGYCLPTRKICSVRCTSSAGCPSAYRCGIELVDSSNVEADCVPLKGKGEVAAGCTKDADCAAGHCYNGFCMEGCATDKDCASSANQCVTVHVILKGALPTYKGCLPRVGTSEFSLGTFNADREAHGVDIPPGASSFMLTTEVKSTTAYTAISAITDPAGTTFSKITGGTSGLCVYYSMTNRYYPEYQLSTLMVPITPAYKLTSGVHTYWLDSSAAGEKVEVKVQLKMGQAQKGTLNLNWIFLNLAGTCIPGSTLNAASAPSHTWFNKLRSNLAAILKLASLSVGKETYSDLVNPALDVISLGSSGTGELAQLFASSAGGKGKAINVFFVRDIQDSATAGAIVLGMAGGIPGPPGIHGTVNSGVTMSMKTACFEQYGYNPAHTLAHELGHYLGLFHNLESPYVPGYYDGQIICPCPCGTYLTCYQETVPVSGQWCRGLDPIPDTDTSSDNLMYYAAESTEMFKGNKLTAGQIRVMLDNPLVGH